MQGVQVVMAAEALQALAIMPPLPQPLGRRLGAAIHTLLLVLLLVVLTMLVLVVQRDSKVWEETKLGHHIQCTPVYLQLLCQQQIKLALAVVAKRTGPRQGCQGLLQGGACVVQQPAWGTCPMQLGILSDSMLN